MKYALCSVSDKTGILEFARGLEGLGYTILSTGGTHRVLSEAGIKNLQEVSDFTGFPEGLEGRIKTLTPQIFGGILNLRNDSEHQRFCAENHLSNIDLVCVNLYPFKATYEDSEKSFQDKVENIDIGGPSMIRAAAKNYEFCAPVVDPEDYPRVLEQLKIKGELDPGYRKQLATKVFEMTAHYDLLIAKFWAENDSVSALERPKNLDNQTRPSALRYGENPHQSAVVLRDPFVSGPDLVGAELLNGKPLSYNNLGDASGALELALSFVDFDQAFATIIKHATPCGAAIGETIEQAFDRAYQADPLSAFGGVIALTRSCDETTAKKITSFFNEIVIAPDYTKEALEILRHKPNLRVLKIPHFFQGQTQDIVLKKIRGGLLAQDMDIVLPDFGNLKIPTKTQPSDAQKIDLEIAWKLVKLVKSNAIVVVKDGVMIGKGGGQTSRVEALQIALAHAGEKAMGAVIASDAFFPFPDSVELAGGAGISAFIQPGGARGDAAVFEKCDEFGIATVLTGLRSFWH
jgi:phosphoribosylaminoimidazolecarboxamide formyltransferase / IMP cyclohydrolase